MMFAAHDTTLCSIQSCLHWLKLVLGPEREDFLTLFAGHVLSVCNPKTGVSFVNDSAVGIVVGHENNMPKTDAGI